MDRAPSDVSIEQSSSTNIAFKEEEEEKEGNNSERALFLVYHNLHRAPELRSSTIYLY